MSVRLTFRDLCRRYAHVFRASWRIRHQLDPVPRLRHESEFLPATLALRDTPVHPAPRVAMSVILGLLAIAISWACLGRVDVVATAPGKIIPNGDVKSVQSQSTAVITAIYVKNGQKVTRGEALIDLDATDAKADAAHAQSDLFATRDEVARAQAMLEAINHHHAPVWSVDPSLGSMAAQRTEKNVLDGEYANYVSNLSKMQINSRNFWIPPMLESSTRNRRRRSSVILSKPTKSLSGTSEKPCVIVAAILTNCLVPCRGLRATSSVPFRIH